MTKTELLLTLGRAYNFPDYYAANLDSAEEIIEDIKEDSHREKLSIKPLLAELLAEESEAEREKVMEFLEMHFKVE